MFAIAAVVTGIGIAEAQQKHKISYRVLPANTEYKQQHSIDVGDVPGHVVRIYEIHGTYPQDAPMFEGVRVVETWRRGYSDYVNINGLAWGYDVFVLENGDKIFARYQGTSQTLVDSDGSKKSTFAGVRTFTGGTGKFGRIRGTTRSTIVFEPKTGFNEGKVEGEYWLDD